MVGKTQGPFLGTLADTLCSLSHIINSLGPCGTLKKGGKMLSIFRIFYILVRWGRSDCSVLGSLDRELGPPETLFCKRGNVLAPPLGPQLPSQRPRVLSGLSPQGRMKGLGSRQFYLHHTLSHPLRTSR